MSTQTKKASSSAEKPHQESRTESKEGQKEATSTAGEIKELARHAPVSGPVPAQLNDTRADGDPILGQFVEVTKGKHEGTYGVFLELEGDNTAVIRARDEIGQRLTVPLTSLKASRAGKR